MKKKASLALMILLLILGLGFLLYPTISNGIHTYFRTLEFTHYTETVEQLEQTELDAEIYKAMWYNSLLIGADIEDSLVPADNAAQSYEYDEILNIDGVIGFLEIPAIDVNLAIFHGTGKESLKKGIGHVKETAFPVGGEGSHSVLAGHTGMSSAKMLNDLVKLEIGDEFFITVLNQTLIYKVDQILVVTPREADGLRPVPGEDYVTLITCTPYGVNSHRLLVRGTRIATQASEQTIVSSETGSVLWINWRAIIVTAVILLVVILLIGAMIHRSQRDKKKAHMRRFWSCHSARQRSASAVDTSPARPARHAGKDPDGSNIIVSVQDSGTETQSTNIHKF